MQHSWSLVIKPQPGNATEGVVTETRRLFRNCEWTLLTTTFFHFPDKAYSRPRHLSILDENLEQIPYTKLSQRLQTQVTGYASCENISGRTAGYTLERRTPAKFIRLLRKLVMWNLRKKDCTEQGIWTCKVSSATSDLAVHFCEDAVFVNFMHVFEFFTTIPQHPL